MSDCSPESTKTTSSPAATGINGDVHVGYTVAVKPTLNAVLPFTLIAMFIAVFPPLLALVTYAPTYPSSLTVYVLVLISTAFA
nr:MAG TPA: hypothetical protein [Caudoviricetes sp.]